MRVATSPYLQALIIILIINVKNTESQKLLDKTPPCNHDEVLNIVSNKLISL